MKNNDEEQWDGYTLDELRLLRAQAYAKREMSKRVLNTVVDDMRQHPWRAMGSSLLGLDTTSMLTFAGIAFKGFNFVKKILPKKSRKS